MHYKRVIPCLDVDEGRVVKGVGFVDLRDAGDPVELASRYDAVAWAREGAQRGAGEILLTSMDRDGTTAGYDLELTSVVTGAVTVPVIASGGAGTPDHLVAAVRAGADAVLCASIFHYGRHTVPEVKQQLARTGIPARMTD